MSVPEPVDTGAIDIQGGGMFRALSVYNYRVWFTGALVSSLGTWMQATAMSWVVLTELTDGDASAMGFTVALQFVPALLLIPVIGRVVDRFDRRSMLFVTSSSLGALALVLGVLLLLGVLTLPLMFVFAGFWGIIAAFDQPLRQSFFGDIVAGDKLVNAVSLGSVQFNVARLVGPAMAGVLIAVVGSGWLFILNTLTFLVLIVALAMMRKSEFIPRLRDAASTNMAAAFRYVRHRSDIVLLLVIVLVSSGFATQFPIYAAAVAVSYHEPSWAFGLLTSCYAVGSLTGAFFMARLRIVRMRRIVAFAFLVAVATLVSALMPNFWGYAIVAVGCGYTIVTLMATANAYMQVHTERAVRGRVLVLYTAAFTGGAPFGAPVIGIVANEWGARGAVALVAGTALVTSLIGLGWYLWTGRVRRSKGSRFGVAFDTTMPIQLPTFGDYDAVN
jgi:MFS family permease